MSVLFRGCGMLLLSLYATKFAFEIGGFISLQFHFRCLLNADILIIGQVRNLVIFGQAAGNKKAEEVCAAVVWK